jgi:hypothetical protein
MRRLTPILLASFVLILGCGPERPSRPAPYPYEATRLPTNDYHTLTLIQIKVGNRRYIVLRDEGSGNVAMIKLADEFDPEEILEPVQQSQVPNGDGLR